MASKPSIKDVARRANVSTATVSYSLTGNGRVSAATASRVKRVAAAMGFVRDSSAARLRTGRSQLLGVIVVDITNPYFAELVHDFQAAALAAGYMTIIASSGDDLELQNALIDALLGQGVDGLLISPSHTSDPGDLAKLKRRGIPHVLCVRDIGKTDADFVGQNDHEAGRLAGEHLLQLGYASFAFVGGHRTAPSFRARLAGLRKASRAAGTTLPTQLVYPTDPDRDGGAAGVRQLLHEQPNCKAVVCYSDHVALGAYTALAQANLQAGRDYAVVGIDNIPQSAALLPPLTTVETFPRTVGTRSAAILLRRVGQGKRTVAERILVEPRLVVRDSACAPEMLFLAQTQRNKSVKQHRRSIRSK